jgi:hypothetical protein
MSERDTEPRGAPFVDAEGMGAILMVQNSVKMGTGKPGPGDVWKFPTASAEAPTEGDAEATVEPAPAESPRAGGLLHRLIRRG